MKPILTHAELAALLVASQVVTLMAIVSILAWIATYSYLARWWSNAVGRSLVLKSGLLLLTLVALAFSLFVPLTPFWLLVAHWAEVVCVGLISPVMAWRCVVWVRLCRGGGVGEVRHDGECGETADKECTNEC